MGLMGMAGAGGVATGLETLFNQRMQQATLAQQADEFTRQLAQQDALTRLKAQELAEATRTREQAAEENRQDRRDRAVAAGAALQPIGSAVSPEDYTKQTAAGLPASLYTVTPGTAATLPSTQYAPAANAATPFSPLPDPLTGASGAEASPQTMSPLQPITSTGAAQPPKITFGGTEAQRQRKLDEDWRNAIMQQRADAAAGKTGATDEKARYLDIDQRLGQGLPTTPEERAWHASYEKEKTLSGTLSSKGASERQTKSEDFTEHNQGKKELTDNVEKDARTKLNLVSELRDVVASAKEGNPFSASQQLLSGAIVNARNMGLNRLPLAETKAAGEAGSLWQRIQGLIGKQATGQSVSGELQKGLTDFADIVEKHTKDEYLHRLDTVKKRYHMTDEEPNPEFVGTGPTGGAGGGGGGGVSAKEGDVKPIPGYPGTEQTYRNGKWIRTK
jgi:ribosomal protein S18